MEWTHIMDALPKAHNNYELFASMAFSMRHAAQTVKHDRQAVYEISNAWHTFCVALAGGKKYFNGQMELLA